MNEERSTRRILIGLTITFLFLLTSCSSGPAIKEITLVAEDIVWDQNAIDLQVGQTVNLTLRNDGALDHTFVAKELDLNVLLGPGETKELSFVVSDTGTLSYICDIPGHEEAGMAGEFIVSE
jgi:plastocyanin